MLLAICLVVAGWRCWPTRSTSSRRTRRSGRRRSPPSAPVGDAGCDPVQQDAATGNQEHVAEGTKVEYAQSPPDSGKHYPSPASFTKHFYSSDDRPDLETLVHNLEHGYTLAWYRADAPEDEIATLRQAAGTFGSETYDPSQKFVAAPDPRPTAPSPRARTWSWPAGRRTPRTRATRPSSRASGRAAPRSAARPSPTSWPSTRSPAPPSPTARDLVLTQPVLSLSKGSDAPGQDGAVSRRRSTLPRCCSPARTGCGEVPQRRISGAYEVVVRALLSSSMLSSSFSSDCDVSGLG